MWFPPEFIKVMDPDSIVAIKKVDLSFSDQLLRVFFKLFVSKKTNLI